MSIREKGTEMQTLLRVAAVLVGLVLVVSALFVGAAVLLAIGTMLGSPYGVGYAIGTVVAYGAIALLVVALVAGAYAALRFARRSGVPRKA